MSFFAVENLGVRFGGVVAVDGVSFSVNQGEVYTIIGPNGAGKTTMMDVVTGKTRPDGGDVFFDGTQDLTRLDANLGTAIALVDKLQAPVARGVSPKGAHTRADNTMLGGAAKDRGMPPGKGGDVTSDSGRGQRGGTPEVQQLRDGIKAAWEKLEEAKSDLDKVARAYDTTAKLPEP